MRMVDLSKARVGDIAIFRGNSTGVIDCISNTDTGDYPFEVRAPYEENSYQQDGTYLRGEESNEDIIKIISNPHGKTLAEIVEDGVKTARPKPAKFLFKGESEPRELKVGDRLIYSSGCLHDVVLTASGSLNLRSLSAGVFRPLPSSTKQAQKYLFVHCNDEVVRHEEGDHGILKYETPEQIVVNTVDGLQIWPRDLSTFI